MPWLVYGAGLGADLGARVRVHVQLTPNSSRDEILGCATLADGKNVLKIKVRAVPEKGKANKALIVFLAKQLKQAKSTLELVSGAQSRHKIVEIDGDVEEIFAKLNDLSRT